MRLTFGNAARAAALAIASALVAESVLRRGLPADPQRVHVDEMRYLYEESRLPFFRPEGGLWTTARPRALEQSFPIAKPIGEKRIFIVGESVALRFPPHALAAALAKPNAPVAVIDAGMGSYDSGLVRRTAHELPRYGADVLVVMMGNNDAGRPENLSYPLWRVNLALRRSALWRLAQDHAFARRATPETDVEAIFEQNLRGLVESAHQAGVSVVLCTLPSHAFLPMLPGAPPPCSPQRNEAIRRIARQEGAALADLDAAFAAQAPHRKPGWDSFLDEVHWRRRLDPLVAEVIAAAIEGRTPRSIRISGPVQWSRAEFDELEDRSLSYAVQAGMQTPPVLLERVIVELTFAARNDAVALRERTASPDALSARFAANPWTQALAPEISTHWDSVRRHVAEAFRRASR